MDPATLSSTTLIADPVIWKQAEETLDLLLTSAEISTALLGFAAIVSVLRGDLTNWQPEGRFWVMVVLSSSAFCLALVPVPFLLAGSSPNLTWGFPAFLIVLDVIAITRVALWGQRIQSDLGIKTHRPTQIVFLILLFAVAALGIGNLGIGSPPTFWRHFSGLVVLQIMAVLFFVRLLRLWLVKDQMAAAASLKQRVQSDP